MGRGVPLAGFRMTAARKARVQQGLETLPQTNNIVNMNSTPFQGAMYSVPVLVKNETDEEIMARLGERFDVMASLVDSAIEGDVRSLIISGPAGVGKSYMVDQKLKEYDPNEVNHKVIKGYAKATGLYKALYACREEGQIVVFDDADSIFFDDVALNILKAVCDTSEVRKVSWATEAVLVDDETGDVIPKSFEFEGTVIFISNYDFDGIIAKGTKLAPHLQALVSRSYYINLDMRSRRDCLLRIRQVLGTSSDLEEVYEFIEDNIESVRELSIRTAVKIQKLHKKGGKWEMVAKVTCCKN